MRSRKLTAHYCDHCSKRMFQVPAMERHEKHCTANPDRECGMCKCMSDIGDEIMHGKSVTELQAIAGNGDSDGAKRLREACNNCPACILAVSRKATKEYLASYDDKTGMCTESFFGIDGFEWQEELQAWRNRVSAIKAEEYEDNCAGWY